MRDGMEFMRLLTQRTWTCARPASSPGMMSRTRTGVPARPARTGTIGPGS